MKSGLCAARSLGIDALKVVPFMQTVVILHKTYLRHRLPVGGGCVYVLQFFFVFLFFFPSTKTMRQPFSGTAERIFMKLLPNDGGGGM